VRKLILLFVALAVVAALAWHGGRTPSQAIAPPEALTQAPAPRQGLSIPAFLPPEALNTVNLIHHGGPYPYDQDNSVFGNRERRLPAQPRGYYHEYTVVTPGASNRGTRRIITGGSPPATYYYTDDHYETFHPFQVSP
jgi:guanyl-specific ribonuclease Sa